MDTSVILSQRTMPWGNEKLGSSKYYIHAYGSIITELAELFGTTPDIVNGTLNAVNGFSADATGEIDTVIWEKIVAAFPGWSAQFFDTYNNDTVVEALQAGRGVIVLVDSPETIPGVLHAVRYIGNGKCHDPFTGTERPTNDFPNVKAFVVLTKMPAAPSEPETPITSVPEAPIAPAAPESSPAVTMANLPMHEKNAILAHMESATLEIKKLLGL